MRYVVDGPVVRIEMTRAEIMDVWEFVAPMVAMRREAAAMDLHVPLGGYSPGGVLGRASVLAKGGSRQDGFDPLIDVLRAAVYEMAGVSPARTAS